MCDVLALPSLQLAKAKSFPLEKNLWLMGEPGRRREALGAGASSGLGASALFRELFCTGLGLSMTLEGHGGPLLLPSAPKSKSGPTSPTHLSQVEG